MRPFHRRSTGAARHGRAVAILWLASMCGCGGESVELTDVSGKATFQGNPIAYGQIQFVPDSNSRHSAPAGHAEIVDGTYDTALGGKGVLPGAYEIRVTAYPSRPPDPAPAASTTEDIAVEPTVKPLFVGYSVTADVQPPQHDIDVPAAAEGFNLFAPPAAPAGGAGLP